MDISSAEHFLQQLNRGASVRLRPVRILSVANQWMSVLYESLGT